MWDACEFMICIQGQLELVVSSKPDRARRGLQIFKRLVACAVEVISQVV